MAVVVCAVSVIGSSAAYKREPRRASLRKCRALQSQCCPKNSGRSWRNPPLNGGSPSACGTGPRVWAEVKWLAMRGVSSLKACEFWRRPAHAQRRSGSGAETFCATRLIASASDALPARRIRILLAMKMAAWRRPLERPLDLTNRARVPTTATTTVTTAMNRSGSMQLLS